MRRTHPLIAGGGPAGAAAAILLARGGAKPRLLDRNRGVHDCVCGGFLGWDALASLDRLGLDVAALGARRITRLRVVVGTRVAEAALPHAAAGFSRAALDAALLVLADRAGAGIERGVTIRRIADDRTLHLADGTALTSEALFLATGKTDLRGLPRPRDAAGPDPAIGLRAILPHDPALAGLIELHLFPGGYAGLLHQEDGTNLCLSVRRSRFAAAGSDPASLVADLARVAPRLADRVRDPGPWSAIAAIPYGWRATAATPGLFRLGDQAAVIASLAGDGVAIALASARAATEVYLKGGTAADFQPAFARRARRPLAIAGLTKAIGEHVAGGPLLALLAHVPGLPALVARGTRIGG